MKKIMILVSAVALSLAACGKKKDAATTPAPATDTTAPADGTEPAADGTAPADPAAQ